MWTDRRCDCGDQPHMLPRIAIMRSILTTSASAHDEAMRGGIWSYLWPAKVSIRNSDVGVVSKYCALRPTIGKYFSRKEVKWLMVYRKPTVQILGDALHAIQGSKTGSNTDTAPFHTPSPAYDLDD